MTTFKVEERGSIFQFRHQGRLLDVKLAGEGGFVRAHRVVLAAGFHTLFFSNYLQYFSSLSFSPALSNIFPRSPFIQLSPILFLPLPSSAISNIFPRSPFLQLSPIFFLVLLFFNYVNYDFCSLTLLFLNTFCSPSYSRHSQRLL